MFLKDVEEGLYALLNRDKQINYPHLDYAIFVRRVEGRKLYDAVFKHRDKERKDNNPGYKVVAWAREAELRVNLNTHTVTVQMRYGEALEDGGEARNGAGGGCFGSFEKLEYAVPLPPDFGRTKAPKARDLSWQEILDQRDEWTRYQEQVGAEIALGMAQSSLDGSPLKLEKHINDLRNMRHNSEAEVRALDTELQMRPAIAFGCLFFVLVGCPAGIWFSKSDYLSAFIICFLPIIFLYYPLLLCGTGLARDGKILPLLSVWAADALMGLIAVGLYWRLLKH
jgi:lipopolysaccharide export system permease protein